MTERTRIKFCGMTSVEDALYAASIGVDAIGLVFQAESQRKVEMKVAQEIVEALPAFVTTVGLFVDANPADIDNILGKIRLDLLQFHGDETPEQCIQHGIGYLKALRVQRPQDIEQGVKQYWHAKGILLDSYNPFVKGGTGEVFDWNMIPETMSGTLILAGGLNSHNVKNAILRTKPYGVDVSSGIEDKPGIKDKQKMKAFVTAVKETHNVE